MMITTREFCPGQRYAYDWGDCSVKNGFAQIDTCQDASYFGIWASVKHLIVFTFAEGDCIIRKAANEREFVQEIRDIKIWNNENGYTFKGIDTLCNDELTEQFKAVGLADLLH